MAAKRARTRYERAIRALVPTERSAWKDWERAARVSPTGARVAANCHREEQFLEAPQEAYAAFLRSVLGQATRGVAPPDAFDRSSHRHQRRGPEARVSVACSLHRLRTEDEFRSTLRQITGLTGRQFEHYWSALRRRITDPRASDADRLAAFTRDARNLPLHRCGYQVFVTFAPRPSVDPLTGLRAGRICDVLGLPRSAYRPGSVLWRFVYTLDPHVTRHVPTVADAGWRSEFAPASAGSPHGWTLDLAARPSARGLPEAVHAHPKPGAMRYLTAPEEMGVIDR